LAGHEKHSKTIYPTQPPPILSAIACSALTTQYEHIPAKGIWEKTDSEAQPRSSSQKSQVIAGNSNLATQSPSSEADKTNMTCGALTIPRQPAFSNDTGIEGYTRSVDSREPTAELESHREDIREVKGELIEKLPKDKSEKQKRTLRAYAPFHPLEISNTSRLTLL
jgi:hypothetical protein